MHRYNTLQRRTAPEEALYDYVREEFDAIHFMEEDGSSGDRVIDVVEDEDLYSSDEDLDGFMNQLDISDLQS